MADSGLKRSALIVASVAAFLTPFMVSSIVIALPTIGQEFHSDAVSLGWVTLAYSLAAAMFLMPLGRFADIHGRRKVFIWGVAVYAVSTILSAMATSLPMLIACRAIEGFGASMLFGTGTAILTSVYGPAERGRALGINVAAVYLGLSFGPLVGGFITQALGWRAIFLATLPLALLIIALAAWKLPGEWAEARGERFDWVGSLIYGAALVAVMYGFTRLPGVAGFALLAAGVAGLAAFAAWEGRQASPVLDIRLFRENTVFAFSNLAALFNYSATNAVSFFLSLYLQYIKGLSPQWAGLVLVAQPAIQAIFSPLAGQLSDRIEPRLVASAGMALVVVGLVLLTFLGGGTPLAFVIAALVLLGLGFALFSSPNTNAVMSSVDRRRYGVASGMLGTMRLTGQMLSMGIAMLVFTLVMGRVAVTPEYAGPFVATARPLFAVFAVLCTLGILASLARGKVTREA
ncbi:MAG TPA: MFS transporter [Anaerolineae bacterium]|nr:MFS transporter [Anaerolineae bacterium]HOQ98101.1 MFS transporter [Anaerolineae bacterium]HPL26812.1 MFS transporter [Anaerolineae bacterium]HPL26815.1 MFS transporter [Anaerolineae bacterium]